MIIQRLFSSSSREQKEFARRDYEGLNEEEKKILKNRRSDYAKGLRKAYRSSMDGISKLDPHSNVMKSTLEIDGGGVVSNVKQTTTRGYLDRGPITELHKNGVRNNLINKTLPEVKQILREESKKEAKQIAELGNKKGKEAAAERDLQIKQENSKLRNEFRDRVKEYKAAKKKEAERKAEKAAKSKASIAKHEAKAAELRAKKETGKMLKKGGKIALATGGVVAAGIGAKKLADKKKAKKEEKK